VEALGRWDAIPATVTVWLPPPRVRAHARRCGNGSSTVERVGTGRRLTYSCTPYGPTSATPSSLSEDITAVRCPCTHEDATVRVQDMPWWPDCCKDRLGGRLLYSVAHHAPSRSSIARRACDSLLPWSIKGGRTPLPQGDRRPRYTTHDTRTTEPNTRQVALALQFSHNIFSHYTRDLEAPLPLPPCL
jgi:hypothetical protein